LQNGTAVFLKTDKKFEFYWVNSECQPNEITPIEAFKLFEAASHEKSCKLLENHHEQVAAAIKHFETLEHKMVAAQTDPEALGGVAQRAKKFLSELAKHPQISEKQIQNIQKMIALIDIGKYTNLPTDIDRLQKKKLNLNNALTELDKIAQQYNVDLSDAQKGKKGRAEKPILIISESFM